MALKLNNNDIIDFHTHTFPNSIADRALHKLSLNGNLKYYTNGITDGLQTSMRTAGIKYSVLMPIVTKPGQEEDINSIAMLVNSHSDSNGLVSFGGIHPENYNYKEIIDRLWKMGIKGIKFHPLYQDTPVDDPLYLDIIDYALDKDFLITIHAGKDISLPANDYSSVARMKTIVDTFNSYNIILAHMAGWDEWDEAEELLIGKKFTIDTAFCLNPIRPVKDGSSIHPLLSPDQFVRMVRNHGVSHVLVGSDSPWSDQGESIELIKSCGLSEKETHMILCENPANLLTNHGF